MKRLRKILKWAGLSAGMVIAVLLIANAWYVWSTGNELATRLQALRQAGEPIQLADLAHPPIPPEQNAETYFRRALNDLDSIQKELFAAFPPTGSPSVPVSTADRARLEKLFAAYPKLMPLLEQAADAPDYDPQFDLSLPIARAIEPYMNRVQENRKADRVVRARARMLLAQGRFDDALASYLIVLRLTRHWQQDLLLIGYLVTVAGKQTAMAGIHEVLRSGTISAASRKALDDELARHDSLDDFKRAIRSERAFSLDSVRDMPMSGLWITRGFINAISLGILDLFDRQLQDVELPAAQVLSGKRTAPKVGRWPNPYGPMVTVLENSLEPLRGQVAERVRALSRSLRVVNAIQLRVPAGSDAVPKLADLGLPAEVTIDPFNGEPLHVKKLPEGWLVYSVGSNLIDDGGTLEKMEDVGFGPIRPEDEKKNH